MATDLVERVSPKLHGLSDSAGKATSDVAGVWRDRGAPAAAAAMTTMREKAAPAAKKAVKEHAVPAAIAAGITVRDRARPIAIAVYGSMSERAGNMRDRMADSDVAAAQRVTMAKAARQAAAATKPHRDEAGRRIRAMQRAAAGQDIVETKRRGIPLLLLVFLVGAAAGAVASAFARRNPPESYSGGFQESLNGVHGSETQPAETSKESNS